MTTILIAAGALAAGAALGTVYSAAAVRRRRRRARKLRAVGGKKPKNLIRSITRFLFVTTQVFAILWVTWSYLIATYSTVALMQPFPAEELSREAVRTILGVGILKVVENVFEHNEGSMFGQSKAENDWSDEGEGGAG